MISNKASNSVTKIGASLIANCFVSILCMLNHWHRLPQPCMIQCTADHDVHASLPRSVLCTALTAVVRTTTLWTLLHSLPTKATGTYAWYVDAIIDPWLYKVPDHLPDKELQSHDFKIPHSFSPAPRFVTNNSEHVACGFVYLQRPRSFTPGIHVHLASRARSRTFHLAWDVQVVLANQKRRFTWSPTDCLSGGSERNKVGVRDYGCIW